MVVIQDFLPGFEPPPDLTSDDKYTPEWLWPHIQKAIAGDQRIALDPCADPTRSFPAQHHITASENCLTTDWALLLAENENAAPRTAYMNPPYSDSEPFLRRWVEYVDSLHILRGLTLTLAGVLANKKTQPLVKKAQSIVHPCGRINFRHGGGSNDRDVVFIFWGKAMIDRRAVEFAEAIGGLYCKVGG